MRKVNRGLGLILLLLVSSTAYSQNKYSGMVKVEKNLYFDATEVDVGSWLSYYTWMLEHQGCEAAKRILPDSSAVEPEVWKYISKKSGASLDLLGRYTLQPIGNFCERCSDFITYDKWLNSIPEICPFLDFPITGINYEQAVDFCKWRTMVLGGNKVVYRLPTKEEWIAFANKGLSDHEKVNRLRDSLQEGKCPTYNYWITFPCDALHPTSRQNGTGRYSPEKTKAFDVFGNVSEMTSEEGEAKGGNYKLYARQCHYDSIQRYTKPEVWLGFRCIAVRNTVKADDFLGVPIAERKITDQRLNDSSTAKKWSSDKFVEFTDRRDGKTYHSVQIGDQVWMAENLAFKPDSGKYWAYRRDKDMVFMYGYLYNWQTATEVCPDGWHLPNKYDFNELIVSLGKNPSFVYSQLIPLGNSGFLALMAGLRFDIDYTAIGAGTAFWSSTEITTKKACGLTVGRIEPIAYVDDGWYKNYGLYVRCIKNK